MRWWGDVELDYFVLKSKVHVHIHEVIKLDLYERHGFEPRKNY
jgi:hypothetical protein